MLNVRVYIVVFPFINFNQSTESLLNLDVLNCSSCILSYILYNIMKHNLSLETLIHNSVIAIILIPVCHFTLMD